MTHFDLEDMNFLKNYETSSFDTLLTSIDDLIEIAERFGQKGKKRIAVNIYKQILLLDENNKIVKNKLKDLYNILYITRSKGSKDSMHNIEWSPNGQYFATTSFYNMLYIWRFRDKRLLRILDGHSEQITALTWHPNNRYIISGSKDKTIRVWNILTGSEYLVLKKHKDTINKLILFRNGNNLISGSGDKTIKAWDLNTGDILFDFKLEFRPEHIVISPDEKYIATFNPFARGIQIISLENGELMYIIDPDKKTDCLTWDTSGRYILYSHEKNRIFVWDTKERKLKYTFTKHANRISAIAISPDGQYVASGDSKLVYVWDINKRKVILKIDNLESLESLTWSPRGDTLFCRSEDQMAIWSLRKRKKLNVISPLSLASSFSINNEGTCLVVCEDNTIKLWDSEKNSIEQISLEETPEVYSLAWSPNKDVIAVGMRQNKIPIWDINEEKVILSLDDYPPVFPFKVSVVSWSPDGKYLAAGSIEETINVWDVSSKQLVSSFIGHINSIRCLAWSPNGKYIASGARDSIIIWDFSRKTIYKTIYEGGRSLAFSPDSRHLIYVTEDNNVEIWNLQKNKKVYSYVNELYGVERVAWHPKLPIISIGMDFGGFIRIKDLKSKDIWILKAYSKVTSLEWSRDGRFLASGSYDGSIRIWDTTNFKLLKKWNIGSPVSSLSWNKNSNLLAISTISGDILVISGIITKQ